MREQSKWREIEKCGWKCFALVHIGWMTGQESPSPLSKPGCPPQAASHHGWSWVRWGTGWPLWFGFLGIERQNYVITGTCRTNQKHQPPVNNTFPFFINLLLDLSSISQYLFLLSVSFSDCHFSLHKCKCFRCFLGTGSGCPFLLYSVNLLWVPLMCSLQPGPFPEFQPFLSHSNSPFGNSVGISNRFGQNETLTSISSLVRISVNDIMKQSCRILESSLKHFFPHLLTVHHQIL